MNNIAKLWRTTTVRLTALFILIFIVFSFALLGYVGFQSSIEIQRAQSRDVAWEIRQFRNLDKHRGMRALAIAVQRISSQPGPGIYYLGNPAGEMIAGNFFAIPPNVLSAPGQYSFPYSLEDAFDRRVRRPAENQQEEHENSRREGRKSQAIVRSVVLDSGLLLVVGRDIVQRRDFTQIIVRTLAFGLIGIVLFSAIAGVLTARRVLRRIDTINATSAVIMSGNMSERVPVTKRDDEFDQLATGLNEMLDRIEQLMLGLKQVTDNVAHDLKTPLTRLRNRAEAALREGSTDADHRQALEATIAESDQLISTFNALLLIARIEAGSSTDALSDVDVSQSVEDVCELYGPVIEDAGGQLIVDIERGINLHANHELLSQALVNLLENTIKYALKESAFKAKGEGNGGKQITSEQILVSLGRQNGRVLITVTDHGPGIPEKDRARVLERFVRLEKSRTKSGSGLGLALVAAVAKLHKGSFEIHNAHPGVKAVISLPETK